MLCATGFYFGSGPLNSTPINVCSTLGALWSTLSESHPVHTLIADESMSRRYDQEIHFKSMLLIWTMLMETHSKRPFTDSQEESTLRATKKVVGVALVWTAN